MIGSMETDVYHFWVKDASRKPMVYTLKFSVLANQARVTCFWCLGNVYKSMEMTFVNAYTDISIPTQSGLFFQILSHILYLVTCNAVYSNY